MNIGDLLKDPKKAEEILEVAIINKNKELAELLIPIVRDPILTFGYVVNIVKGKIKDEWEEIIVQDLYASFDYAFNILNAPFPKGEDIISKDAYFSYRYAKEILNSRFKKGEETIIKDKYYLNKYVKFLKSIGKLDEFLKDHQEVKL
jgi:hypothetical protein